MHSIWKWSASAIALGFMGCIGGPTCEDLATCPLEGSVSLSPPADGGGGNTPGAGSAMEHCANDEDDDGDGKIDCADLDCTTNPTCMDKLPLDFDGFAVISFAPINSPSPTCADGTGAAILYQNPNEQLCGPCSCDVSSVSCTAPAIALDAETETCAMPVKVIKPALDTCVSTNLFQLGLNKFLKSGATQGDAYVVKGECTVEGGAPIASPAMNTKVAVCEVKYPSKVQLGNDERLCLVADGHKLDCPTGWDAVATNAFTGYVDERQGCAPCGCSAGCWGGDYEFFTQSNCSGNSVTLAAGGACVGVNPTFTFSVRGKTPETTCALKKAEPMGKVNPTGERTFCCKS